jgi:hypothetical protein
LKFRSFLNQHSLSAEAVAGRLALRSIFTGVHFLLNALVTNIQIFLIFRKMRTIILFSFPMLLTACKKETLLESAPSLVGNWKHYSGDGDYHIIEIFDTGDGKMQWYVDNELEKYTKVRTWYMENNTIYFGKIALNGELYEVIDFPAVSGSETIENFDTLKVGKRFIRLEEGYYTEQ